ncbi:CysB family HTH-type transcriptional regulator [Niveibacterium sp. 24ML]|uniref:CysB family HTH-type transcriptional regulator n=1 Tax=Niveibacterium sp. 24ML TaxID=2985512 RepID=UPI0022711A7A|nr:CysB family HTH-type transcriptional regulator [Niveibacterium sp. 24ML]MCX9157739.1 CysB family HTH-type transcriptional regulator [Niveibacterium sp. 24ML]
MNLQQLRYVVEVVRAGLNVSDAADALFTSQPGVSKQIRQLEEELGIEIFVRHGKRLTGITEPGRQVLAIAERMLGEVDSLKKVGAEFRNESEGQLNIATTHTQARYALPRVVQAFVQKFPGVRLTLHQGSPRQVCDWVQDGEADLAIATEAVGDTEGLVSLPSYQWNRCVIATPRHPILKASPLTLEEIAKYPIVTYDTTFAGRSEVNRAFLGRGLKPNVVLAAMDADVIKTYVAMDLGIGLIASIAFDPITDRRIGAVDASHLFDSAVTRIGIRRNAYLRGYVYGFIELMSPHLTRRVVDAALLGGGTDAGL